MRYFISVDVDDEGVKDSLVKFMKEIEGLGDMKTVSPENLHSTLLYLGEQDVEELDDSKKKFIRSCEEIDVGEFMCSVSGIGVFPHLNYIEVVWAGLKPEEKFKKLHMKFSEVIKTGDEGNFVPHITVGRVRGINPADKRALKERIENYPAEFGSFQVSDVRLKESSPGEGGPTYRDVAVCGL